MEPASISDVRPIEVKTSTPGAANSTVALEEKLPRLWLNEFDPVNSNGPMDRFGKRSPWVELFNAGTNSLSLSGFSLGKDPDSSERWYFHEAASIGAGRFLLIWLDGNATQSTEAEWHAGFRPTPGTGTLTLWRQAAGEAQVVDYLEYRSLPGGTSLGWAEDGIPEQRWAFPQPTPALPNTAVPSVSVLINEWMAANTRILPDPADDDFEDWLELYNAGTRPADLSGFTLSDSLTEPKKFAIPPGTVIEPHGHLLVWADDEPEQREVGGEIHANFKLSADGDHLLLSAPDGTQIDSVTFGPQAQDRSEGRWPDGAAAPFRSLTEATPAGRNEWSYLLQLAALRQSLDGQVEAYWASTSGQQFRVQFTEDLTDPIWEDYGQTLTASGPEMQIVIELPPVGHRFFRVILLDP